MNWLQRHWDARAAANFILGGAGSGLLLAGALAPVGGERFVWVALALIAAGLGAVWLEIGRKLRAIHVFFNPFTSWMTRESFAAALVFVSGLSFLILHERAFLYGAALASAAFLYCQARILRAAKGIPAWRAPQVVPLIVSTGLVEGTSLALFFSVQRPLVIALGLLLLVRIVAWRRYRAAVRSQALESPGALLVWLGGALPLGLLVFSPFFPWLAPVAGVAALAAGAWLKLALVTRASFNQGFSLPHLPVRGAR